MLELEAGQEAPGVITEAQTPATATVTAETTPTDTQIEGQDESKPAVERTYTQKEFQESIEKATAKAAAKAERRAYREALETIGRNQQPQVQEQPTADVKPQRQNFSDDESYIDSLTDWKLDQRESVGRQQKVQQVQQQYINKAEAIYTDAMKSGFDREDLNAAAESMTTTMKEALIDSDVAPKLLAFMAANPDEITRIASLSPARQAAEIGKLEAKTASKTVNVSKAPEPITPIGRSGGSIKSLETASMDDFVAMRKKAGSRWIR